MTHSDLINRWPTIVAFATDLGVTYEAAKAMRRRGSVPADLWLRMVKAAEERGIENITLEALAIAAERRGADSRCFSEAAE